MRQMVGRGFEQAPPRFLPKLAVEGSLAPYRMKRHVHRLRTSRKCGDRVCATCSWHEAAAYCSMHEYVDPAHLDNAGIPLSARRRARKRLGLDLLPSEAKQAREGRRRNRDDET